MRAKLAVDDEWFSKMVDKGVIEYDEQGAENYKGSNYDDTVNKYIEKAKLKIKEIENEPKGKF